MRPCLRARGCPAFQSSQQGCLAPSPPQQTAPVQAHPWTRHIPTGCAWALSTQLARCNHRGCCQCLHEPGCLHCCLAVICLAAPSTASLHASGALHISRAGHQGSCQAVLLCCTCCTTSNTAQLERRARSDGKPLVLTRCDRHWLPQACAGVKKSSPNRHTQQTSPTRLKPTMTRHTNPLASHSRQPTRTTQPGHCLQVCRSGRGMGTLHEQAPDHLQQDAPGAWGTMILQRGRQGQPCTASQHTSCRPQLQGRKAPGLCPRLTAPTRLSDKGSGRKRTGHD